MSIFITGATGFIGSQLADKLVKNGETVRSLCRTGADITQLEKVGVEVINGDTVLMKSSSYYCTLSQKVKELCYNSH